MRKCDSLFSWATFLHCKLTFILCYSFTRNNIRHFSLKIILDSAFARKMYSFMALYVHFRYRKSYFRRGSLFSSLSQVKTSEWLWFSFAQFSEIIFIPNYFLIHEIRGILRVRFQFQITIFCSYTAWPSSLAVVCILDWLSKSLRNKRRKSTSYLAKNLPREVWHRSLESPVSFLG